MNRLYPVETLEAVLRKHGLQLEADVKQVLLAGFLEACGALEVPLAAFDAAAEEFLKKTSLPASAWVAFLATLLDARLGNDVSLCSAFERYLDEQAAALKSQLHPGEQPPPEKQELWVTMTAEEVELARGWLVEKQALRGTQLGLALLDWRLEHAGDVFQVQLVNCEGGPCLIGYRRRGARIVDSTRPSHLLSAPFTFDVQTPHVELRLRASP